MKDKKTREKNRQGSERAPVSVYDNAIREALTGYASDKRGIWHKLSRKIDLWRKPRFLIGGVPRNGKTSLAVKSGLRYDFVYSGHLASGDEAPRWFFSEKAAYIDTPGTLADPQRWSEFCHSLKRHKFPKRRAVDGLLLVIDAGALLSMDKAEASRLAIDLRLLADTLVSVSGYEIPLYFVFAKSDKIEGFSELFMDKNAAEKMPVIGAITGDDDSGRQIADVFSSSYKNVYDDISDMCLLKMISADGTDKSLPLCRLSLEFLLADGKISAFIAEFFKYRGRTAPRFRGFFFTSTSSKTGGTSAASPGHILGNVIPNAKFKIREAGAGTLFYRIKKVSFHLLLAIICAVLIFSAAGSGLRDAIYMRTLKGELAELLGGESSLDNQYMALEKLRLSYYHLDGKFKSPGRLIFSTGKARDKIRNAYVAASTQLVVNPAAKLMETSLAKQRPGGRSGELTSDEHRSLYHSLKAYLLLTSGNRVKLDDPDPIAEIIEQSLKKSLGSRYGALRDKVVQDNINTVIKFAADGFYGESVNQKAVQNARERLTAAPRADAVYSAVMGKLHADRRSVSIAQIIGGNSVLRFGHNISALYTRDGWEQTVYPEFINVSKDPFKADWVMGPVKAQIDETKLLAELVALYSDDLSRRWLDFIRNAQISLQSDMSSLASGLDRLSSRESEVKKTLAAVCSLATQEQGALAPASAPKSVSALKEQVANVSNKLKGGLGNLMSGAPDPFTEARKTFGALEKFLSGGGMDDYLRGLNDISEKIKKCDADGGFTPVFAARGDDPLRVCRNSLDKSYHNMPQALSAPLKRILEAPLDFAAAALAKKIGAELEESWMSEIVSFHNDRFAGRYPIDRNGLDLSWNDFEEMFKPQSGTLWKYHDKNLAGMMEKTHKGWEKRPARSLSVPVSINDELINTYNRAEKITNSFFRSDGTPRRQDITFHQLISSGGDAQFFMGERKIDAQSGLPVTVTRPQGSVGDEAVILRLTTLDRTQEDIIFKGEWGLMRIFNHGNIDRLGNDRYRINWRLKVRGDAYTANITAVVHSGSEALFNETVIRGFAVPRSAIGK